MSEAKMRSDLPVTLDPDATCGGDAVVARSAWAMPPGQDKDTGGSESHRRVIRSMVKGRHGSPFERGSMAVYVEAPAVVWWEWTRHRFMGLGTEDESFSLQSGRYKVLDGQFYSPPARRPLREPEGFRPMKPVLMADDTLAKLFEMQSWGACSAAWDRYTNAIEAGVAREAARLLLPFSVYYAGYVSANPRTWLTFFSLRKKDDRSQFPTFPQWEIEQVCEQCEALFAARWPITYDEFNAHGRVSI